ncbi:MAG TPA: hypothetical protein VHL09_03790 [Dehalococcoidia bacterium]|nr:hypothetical protein [Dehalococcoidia bacterium]
MKIRWAHSFTRPRPIHIRHAAQGDTAETTFTVAGMLCDSV